MVTLKKTSVAAGLPQPKLPQDSRRSVDKASGGRIRRLARRYVVLIGLPNLPCRETLCTLMYPADYASAGTFRASARDPKLSHAEALRQSILAMIDAAKSDAEADPRLWAPFVVVGEPAKAQ